MTVPPQPTTAPFGFGAAAAAPVAAPADAAPAPAGPDLGRVVSWTEFDVYDEHRPEVTRYGVVVEYDATGAAQVLPLGQGHRAHFPPAAAAPEGYTGPTVADLTVIG